MSSLFYSKKINTKVITKIQIDQKQETADIDITNNTFCKEVLRSKFD